MIKHIVMWRLKEEAEGRTGAENAKVMKEMLEALVGKVPGIDALEVGINVVPGETASDIVLYTEFATMEILDAYQIHPEHQKVVAFVKSVASERRAVDYEI